MKNKKVIITLIILLSIVMVSVSILFINLMKNNFKFKWNLQVSNQLILDKTYEEAFNKIMIDATTSEIDIKRSQDNKIKTLIYGKEDTTLVTTDIDTLNIKSNEKECIGFCFNQKSSKIEIYLPTDYDGKIVIKNDYGDIYIDEFLKADIDIEEDCGDIEIMGSDNIDITSKYGDIDIVKANKADIEADCGSIAIDNIDDITINDKYGDIKIKNVNNYLDLHNSCGDIVIDNVNLKKDSYIEDDFGDIKIDSTNQIFIDGKVDLGDLKINNNYNKADTTLKINNNCGDIKINN